MSNDDITDILDMLVETCDDGANGFRTGAEHVKSEPLKAFFSSRAEQCREAAAELNAHIVRLGGKAESGTSAMGTLHKGWMNVRGTVSSDSDLAMLEEIERGEDAAVGRYRDAAEQDLPADVAALVQRQYEGAQRNHDQVRNLRDSMKAKD